jgi:class 3 adenylate cyclase/putative methionine-R-sulfoxide reductase with GAF domain
VKRRRTTNRSPENTRHRKAPKAERSTASKTANRAVADLQKQLERQARELEEARQQQAASSEVLHIIGTSVGALAPVFKAIVKSAVNLCRARFGAMFRMEGDLLHLVTDYNFGATQRQLLGAMYPMVPNRGHISGRAILTGASIQIPDIYADEDYKSTEAKKSGFRSLLAAPLLRCGEAIGSIVIYRTEPGEFTAELSALLQTFADQAVIAIENVRLFEAEQQRTAELAESLEQQTATSEVLRVISASPGELEPVFQAMLENAVRICEAKFGNLFRFDGENFYPVAEFNTPAALLDAITRRGRFRPPPGITLDHVMRTKQVFHSADMAAEPVLALSTKFGGARSQVTVPMLKDEALIGAIVIYRQEVRPFTDKQVELVKNFAAQAVIAIENTRLLNELRERTDQVEKLNQHLEQRVTDQVGEIERMGRLRRFLPPQVADLIVASGAEKQLESHRREITALFCDLRGFTGFSESSDPEDVMALLRDYHAAIGEIIIKYSGTLERYAGDGVMVVFNDPVPVDNPALQAVLMALEMRAAIGSLTEKWRRLGHDIGFGIGIAHGFATLGTIGFEGRFDYAAIGTVSNVASRLCDEAKPAQILISPRVLLAVEDAVTVESVGEFALKGIRRPLAAYNVLAARLAN